MTQTNQTAQLPKRRDAKITLQHRFEAVLVHTAFSLFRLLGVDAASDVGGWIGRVIGYRIRGLTKRAERNLERFMPELSAEERAEIAKGVWENLGRTAAEFAHLDAFDPLKPDGRVELVGEHILDEITESGKPSVLVGGHFANWEIMSITLFKKGFNYCLVYRPANNPLVDQEIINRRANVMSLSQAPKSRDGARRMMAAMRSNQSVALLIDQKMNDGIAAPLLGELAMTAQSPARMAIKFRTPIIPVSVERLNGAHFRVTIHEPMPYDVTGDVEADVLSVVTDINAFLGREIRAHPEQWLWLHNRWPKKKS